jgi:tRNA dimethylallyltransferase
MSTRILCIAGPTASGKSSRAVQEALVRGGEVISVDSRQVYRGLDIGTEKITTADMQGIPHHLINILDPRETYSAAAFASDAGKAIADITARGKLPILAGGSHFYFDALLRPVHHSLTRNQANQSYADLSIEVLAEALVAKSPTVAHTIDPKNRRRLLRALELLDTYGELPKRTKSTACDVEWIVVDPDKEVLRHNIDVRLASAFEHGLINEVVRVREQVGDERLIELGLEYRIVGEYLRGQRDHSSLLPALSAKLWQYARRQKAWLRKLRDEDVIVGA